MKVSEIKSFHPNNFYGTRLFIFGPDVPAIILCKRIRDGIENNPDEDLNDYQISYGSILLTIPIDTLFVIDNKITSLEAKQRYPNVYVVHLTEREALQEYGYPELDNSDMIQLNESDWQALRNIERQLLAMHDAGVWILPDDVRLTMIEREALRANIR